MIYIRFESIKRPQLYNCLNAERERKKHNSKKYRNLCDKNQKSPENLFKTEPEARKIIEPYWMAQSGTIQVSRVLFKIILIRTCIRTRIYNDSWPKFTHESNTFHFQNVRKSLQIAKKIPLSIHNGKHYNFQYVSYRAIAQLQKQQR